MSGYLVAYGDSELRTVTLVPKRRRRNGPARADMLAERARDQRNRIAGYSTMDHRRGRLEFTERATLMQGVPASMNRRTGKPHEHARAKARRLRQLRSAGA